MPKLQQIPSFHHQSESFSIFLICAQGEKIIINQILVTQFEKNSQRSLKWALGTYGLNDQHTF